MHASLGREPTPAAFLAASLRILGHMTPVRRQNWLPNLIGSIPEFLFLDSNGFRFHQKRNCPRMAVFI